jgi:hypothetical protein
MLPRSTENLYQLLRLLARKQAILLGERDSTPKSWDLRPNYDFNGDWDGCDSIGSICIKLLDIYQANSLSVEEKWLFKDLMVAIENLALSQKKDLTWLRNELEAVELSLKTEEKALAENHSKMLAMATILGLLMPIVLILPWWFLDQSTQSRERDSSKNVEELRREFSTLGDASDGDKKLIFPKKIQPSRCVEQQK